MHRKLLGCGEKKEITTQRESERESAYTPSTTIQQSFGVEWWATSSAVYDECAIRIRERPLPSPLFLLLFVCSSCSVLFVSLRLLLVWNATAARRTQHNLTIYTCKKNATTNYIHTNVCNRTFIKCTLSTSRHMRWNCRNGEGEHFSSAN